LKKGVEDRNKQIEKAKKEIAEKDRNITNLSQELSANKVIRLNGNTIAVNENTITATGNGWVVDLPSQFTCKAPKLASINSKGNINFGGTADICYITSQYPISIPNVRSIIAINNVTGNIIFDIANKKLTMSGNSFGNFTAQ
jgi:hypothetical protein